jgi:hypothetical protein
VRSEKRKPAVIAGYEAMNIIRKVPIHRLPKIDVVGQGRFIKRIIRDCQ